MERHAHTEHGHFPVTFARFAEALIDQGCTVTALTSRGWARAVDPAFAPLDVRTYGWSARGLDAVAQRMVGTRVGLLGRHLQALALVVAARATARRVGADGIVVVTLGEVLTTAAFAGPGRWLVHATIHPERPVPTPGTGLGPGRRVRRTLRAAADGRLAAAARRGEARRRRAGGCLRVAALSEASRQVWAAQAPWAAPVVLPIGVTAPVRPGDARPAVPVDPVDPVDLGRAPGVRMALCFGAPHRAKDPVTVWRAFRDLPDWRLVVAGQGAAEAYRAWAAAEPAPPGAPEAILVDGYVDEATKRALHAAAGLAVLSFKADWWEDSGTLADAVDHGLPVVCSDRSAPAAEVVRFGLGPVFRAGDPGALVTAVRDLGAAPDPAGLHWARDELSVGTVARRWLEVLGLAAPGPGS
ncbi:MAG: glycosyltransferase [Actinomycetota bacterium]